MAQYIPRNPFAQGKITFNQTTGMVVYKSKMTHSKGEGGKKNFAVYPACDFIAAITQHIPAKRCQMVRYFGWYSNKMRGERRKQVELSAFATGQAGPLPSHEQQPIDEIIYEPFDDGWPQFEEPFITVD